MAELDKLAGPVMRRAARLHANQARRQFGKEWQHLRTSKRLADNDPTGRINAVNLKNAPRGEYFRLISDIGPSRGVALYVLMKPI